MTIRAPVIRPRPQAPLPGGLFVGILGVRDAVEPALSDPRKAAAMTNLYPVGGGHWYGRPGFVQAGAQLFSGAECQGLYQFTKQDGTEYTVGIFDGRFATYDWASDAWTEVLTSTHFTAASITLSTTARFYFETFADQLIVTDGVNTPWAWDGTTGGGLTKLTNAPVAYGPPTVHGAKLFFIKATERTAFVWSEENAPNTGYEATGYDNAWTFAQTDQRPLYRLHGSNVGLYVWRDRALTLVMGSVEADFRSTATDDAVSETVGTTAPGSVVKAGNSIFFVDADGRPQRLTIGGGLDGDGTGESAVWDDAKVTIQDIDPGAIADTQGLFREDLNVVLMAVELNNRSARDRLLVFRPDDGQFCGVWEGLKVSAIGMVKDSVNNGVPRLMHAGSDGYVYFHGRRDETTWSDGLNAGSTSIVHEITSPALFWDTYTAKAFDRIDMAFRVWGELSAVQVSYQTSARSWTASQAVDFDGDEGGVWDVSEWDRATWDLEALEAHGALGLAGEGRWIRARVRHNAPGERFGFSALQVTAFALARWPEIN